MVFFSKDDWAVIVTCFTEKGWTGTRIAKEFPNKKWNYGSINRVLAKYRQTGSIDRKKGSGRPVTAMTDENLAEVEQLFQSQDDKAGTHKSQRQTACIINVSQSSVQRMLKRRRLHAFKRMRTSAVNANKVFFTIITIIRYNWSLGTFVTGQICRLVNTATTYNTNSTRAHARSYYGRSRSGLRPGPGCARYK